MKRLFLLLSFVAFVGLAVWATVPQQIQPKSTISYDQVQVVNHTDYNVPIAAADRSFCVEMVLPNEDISAAVVVFGRTLRPTPPPLRVVWVNKRTSLSGEGVVVR